MFMFITDNPEILKAYLDVRERQGLFHKSRKHLFLTSNELVKDVVYDNEEFQYHGSTGKFHLFKELLLQKSNNDFVQFLPALYLFDQGTCLEDYNDLIDYSDIEVPTRVRCVLFGYYFDTFESFKPLLFTVIEALPEVRKG